MAYPVAPVAPTPPARPKVSPSGWWYVVPVVLWVAAVVVPIVSIVGGFRDANQAALDSNVTGAGEIQTLAISDPGGYTIGYFGPVVVTDDAQKEALAEELSISITPIEGGTPLTIDVYEGFQPVEQVEPGSGLEVQYVPLRTVHFDRAGEYEMRSLPSAKVDRRRSGLVVSESPFRKLRDRVEQGVVYGVVLTFLGTLVMVILFVARKRAKRALGLGPGGQPPDPGLPWAPGPGAPGPQWHPGGSPLPPWQPGAAPGPQPWGWGPPPGRS